jgi:hypothetical protein
VTPGDQDVVVRLGEGIEHLVRIHGCVTRADTGAPVAGARLRWNTDGWGRTVYTGTDGRYALAVPPGEADFMVMARHCAWFSAERAKYALGLHERDVALLPSEPLFVRVRGEDGGVPDVEISAFDESGRQLALLDRGGDYDGVSVDVDRNGRAELGGLPFATLRLHLQSKLDEGTSMEVEVPASAPRDVDFPITWR